MPRDREFFLLPCSLCCSTHLTSLCCAPERHTRGLAIDLLGRRECRLIPYLAWARAAVRGKRPVATCKLVRILGVLFFATEPLREARLGLGQVSRRFSVWLLHCVKLSERPAMDEQRKIKSFCALCVARCGAIATVERGRFVSLEPDPSHPTGQALCAKGRASPGTRLQLRPAAHPLKRTRPRATPIPAGSGSAGTKLWI